MKEESDNYIPVNHKTELYHNEETEKRAAKSAGGKFNENHIRYYSATMHIVADKISEITALADLPKQSWDLTETQIINDLANHEINRIKHLIEELQQRLKEFSLENELLSQPRSVKEMISMRATLLWEALAVTTFDHLQSFGMSDEKRRKSFEKHIRAMIAITEKMIIY